MSVKLRRMRRMPLGIVAMLCAMVLVGAARASTIINYGNFTIPQSQVTFTNVSESSGTDAVPLYGAPHTFVTGLDFDPAGFTAAASAGTADITDGQLNYGVQGAIFQGGGVGINSLSVSEGGDYSLAGTGTTATQALAGVIFNVKVTEVDGVAITPVSFSQNASVGFNLIANPGIVQPWHMSLTVPIAAELTALNIPYNIGATKLEITMNNQLIALSEPQSAAFIAKKDFVITAVTDQHGVPEPMSATLAALFLGGLSMRRRRTA